MRRRLFVAALLATTALTPGRASADPVSGFILGALGASAGTATALGIAAGAGTAFAAGATFAGTFFGGLLVRATLSIGLSFLVQSLQPRPTLPPPSARMVNFAQPVAYAEWVFGRVRKGGSLGFSESATSTDIVTGSGGTKRHYSPILAAHPCAGVFNHFLDEREVEIDGNGLVTTAPMAGYYRIRPFLGGAGQVADPELVSTFPEVTSAHDFAGLTGAHIWALRPPQHLFSDIYPNSREGAYTPVIEGNNEIFDPRSGSTGFTRNAALIMAHWLVAVLGREVDWDDVALEADVADEIISNGDGGTQPRWQLDGVISDDQEFEEQRAQLAAACDAWVYERPDGKIGFRLGRWIEPTVTLTGADFLSCEISSGGWGRDAPSEVAAQYIEPGNLYREATSGAYVIDPDGRKKRDEPQLFMISTHNQAARMNKRIARTKRPEYALRGTIGLIGYDLIGQRFVRVQNAAVGVDAYFEIGSLTRDASGHTFSIEANSVTPEDFDFDPVTEEAAWPVFSEVSGDNAVPVPTDLNGGPLPGGAILWSWAAADASLTQELQFRVVGEEAWESIVIQPGVSQVRTSGFADGDTVEAQLRNRTAALRRSDWAPEVPVTAVVQVNQTAPDALDSFDAVASGPTTATITFEAPNHASYFGTEILRGNSAVFENATLVHTEYGIPSDADSWTDTVPVGTFYYWARPINASGVAGPLSGPVSVTVSTPGP